MRILLDESLPRRLRGKLPGHCVSTVTQCGWSGLENGELLRVAANDFDVFLTADQNLEYQQNLRALPLAIIVLVAHTNTFETLQSLIPDVLDRLARIEPRTLVKIGG